MTYIKAVFPYHLTSFTFKTDLDLSKGEFVIANIKGTVRIGTVVDTDVPAEEQAMDLMSKVDVNYKKTLESFTYVAVKFNTSSKDYTYKTDLDLSVGEQVVVYANGRFEVVEVSKLDLDPPEFKTKVIVSRV